MTLWIQISTGSNEPVYSQIMTQISRSIAQGRLRAGDKLPAVRKLASELVINPNTVAKAYTQLEQAKLVVTKTGSGTYVADRTIRSADMADMHALTERMDNIITRAIHLGLNRNDLADMFRSRLEKFADNPRNAGDDHE